MPLLSILLDADRFIGNYFLGLRTEDGFFLFLLITKFGNTFAIALVIAASLFFFSFTHHRAYIAGLFAAFAGEVISVHILKELFLRARPDAFQHIFMESSYSFPSGHAAGALAVYGFLAYAIWKLSPRRYEKLGALFFASLLILLIGMSRLYLGVHFASDVFGGYIVGGAWLLLGILLTQRLSRAEKSL